VQDAPRLLVASHTGSVDGRTPALVGLLVFHLDHPPARGRPASSDSPAALASPGADGGGQQVRADAEQLGYPLQGPGAVQYHGPLGQVVQPLGQPTAFLAARVVLAQLGLVRILHVGSR